MISKSIISIIVASAVLLGSITIALAHDDQQNQSYSGVDEPRLDGPESGWWRVASVIGQHGDYYYTYGDSNISGYENRAVWNMGHRHGRQRIYVYVPKDSTLNATVSYLIWKNDRPFDFGRINQKECKGWCKLGDWDMNGANVRISASDGAVKEAYDANNPNASKMGIDKITMKCISSCDAEWESPYNIRRLYERNKALEAENREQKTYINCIKSKLAPTANDTDILANAMDIEATLTNLFGAIPGVGTLVSITVYHHSELSDAVRSLATIIRNEFAC